MKKYISLVALLAFMSSCKKDDHNHNPNDINPNLSGNLTIEFDNRVGNLNLVLDSPFYANASGQNYTITRFDYYVSNIVLVNEDGTEFTYPQDSSYFLVKERDPNRRNFVLANVPEGNYSGVRFTIGIDSLRNTKPITERQGDLDVTGAAMGMYWTWNSGYIFLKMEGTFLDTGNYIYHIGGYGGFSAPTINNVKTVLLNFPEEKAEVRAKHGTEGPTVHLYVDASKVISGSTNINFSTHPVVMFSPFSVNIANNYVNMFSLDHVHNHEH